MRKLLIGFVFVSALAAVPAFAVCTSPSGAAGAREWFTGANTYKFCNGTDWIAFSSTTTSSTCTQAATIDYDSGNTVYQVCDGAYWDNVGCSAGPPAPTGCPSIGDTCSDGTYYIGDISGNKIYAASSASEVSKTWNNGTTSWTTTGFTSTTDGPGNTAGLVALSDAGAPYKAAAYCAGLSADGYSSGWYLPAKDELNLFWHGGTPIAGVNTSGIWYWSSTENTNNYARLQRFSDGYQGYGYKFAPYPVRCVRKVDAGACPGTCPDLGTCSAAGAVDYRSGDADLAYCNGTNWVSLGPPVVDACACNPSPGDVCADGSYYIGEISGNKIYATSPASEASEGMADAATYCSGLSAHGQSDWYLPAEDELNLFWNDGAPIAGVDTSGSWYLSSTPAPFGGQVDQRFSDGMQSIDPLGVALDLVRCVRH